VTYLQVQLAHAAQQLLTGGGVEREAHLVRARARARARARVRVRVRVRVKP
jgi:hypothetical protein